MNQPPDQPSDPQDPQGPPDPPQEWGATVPRPAHPAGPTPGSEPTVTPEAPSWPVPPPTQQIPAQPTPQQPGQPAYAVPPTDANAYGVPPGAPGYQPPPKSKTPLLIGLGAAGVLALVAIIIGVLVLTGGDDDERIVSDADTSESAEPSEDATEEPTEEPSDDPTTDEPDPTEDATEVPVEGLLVGDGYSYELPDDWNDISAEILAQNPPGAIDTVSTWGTDIESGRANLITERQIAGTSDPEDLRESWEGNLGNAVGVTPVSGPDSEIDGEKAISATLNSTNNQDVEVLQTAYLVVVDGAVYSVTLSAEDGDDGAQDEFDEILDSWSWE